MRTIIINTLGSELRQNPLFYLPFSTEQFLWMEKPLNIIEECVEDLCGYNESQHTHQGCHIVVLISLASYKLACYEKPRTAIKQSMFAYLNTKLLHPLVQDRKQQVAGVSVVFVLTQPMEGTCGIPTEDIELHVLGIDPEDDNIESIKLSDDNGGQTIDLTEPFANILNDHRKGRENAKNHSLSPEKHSGLNSLRRAVSEKLKQLQTCKYLLPGDETWHTLPVEQMEYRMLTDDWDIFCLDIQLNLSEHLQANLNSDTVWQLKLTPHDPQVLRERIKLAIRRVRYLRQNTPKLSFYELTQQDYSAEPDISGEIWGKLLKADHLPGITEAAQDAELEESELEAKILQEKESLGKKLRHSWLLVGKEKKRFDQYYQQLQDQYKPDVAEKHQRAILDICSESFVAWRRNLLSRKNGLPTEAKAMQMPAFDQAVHEEEIANTQRQWGEAAVAQLEDYADVREEAEEIKAECRKAYRLWPDGEFNATSKFFLYSIVLAALFVLQMLLPYVMITMRQTGVEISRYLHFSFSVLLFVSLYLIGLIIWMRALCKQLGKYTEKMFWLLQNSHLHRRQSIARAVNSYGSILPRCAFCYERLKMMQMIHEENLQRKERYNSHAKLLAKAEEWLFEMRSMLRMPEERSNEQLDVRGGINFELAPSHPKNVPYYAFLSEKWGRY